MRISALFRLQFITHEFGQGRGKSANPDVISRVKNDRVKCMTTLADQEKDCRRMFFQGRRNIFILGGGAKFKKRLPQFLTKWKHKPQTAQRVVISPTFEKLFKIYKNTDMQLCIDHLISMIHNELMSNRNKLTTNYKPRQKA